MEKITADTKKVPTARIFQTNENNKKHNLLVFHQRSKKYSEIQL